MGPQVRNTDSKIFPLSHERRLGQVYGSYLRPLLHLGCNTIELEANPKDNEELRYEIPPYRLSVSILRYVKINSLHLGWRKEKKNE